MWGGEECSGCVECSGCGVGRSAVAVWSVVDVGWGGV